MYMYLDKADVLVKLGLISKDNIKRLGLDGIQLILDKSGNEWAEDEIGVNYSDVDDLFTNQVFISSSEKEARDRVVQIDVNGEKENCWLRYGGKLPGGRYIGLYC